MAIKPVYQTPQTTTNAVNAATSTTPVTQTTNTIKAASVYPNTQTNDNTVNASAYIRTPWSSGSTTGSLLKGTWTNPEAEAAWQEAIAAEEAATPTTPADDYWATRKAEIESWLTEQKDNYDPTAYSYLVNEVWGKQGLDPREFVNQYQWVSSPTQSGWLGSDTNFTGTDYFYNPSTQSWMSRSRTTGADLGGYNFTSPDQAQAQLDQINTKIAQIDADNKRLKDNPFWEWNSDTKRTVEENEQLVKDLRSEYDAITNIIPGLEMEPLAQNLITQLMDSLAAEATSSTVTDPLTEAAREEWQTKLYELLQEELMNEYAPDVMSSMAAYLEPQFQKAREASIASTARMGRLGGGLEAQNLADISSQYSQQMATEAASFAEQLSEANIQQGTQTYNELMNEYLDSLAATYGDEISDVTDFYNASEADINRQVQEWAAQQGIDLETAMTQGNIDLNDYLESLTAISDLFETGALTGTTLASSYTAPGSTDTTDTSSSLPYYYWQNPYDLLSSGWDPWSSQTVTGL